jgi:hypothetical protein
MKKILLAVSMVLVISNISQAALFGVDKNIWEDKNVHFQCQHLSGGTVTETMIAFASIEETKKIQFINKIQEIHIFKGTGPDDPRYFNKYYKYVNIKEYAVTLDKTNVGLIKSEMDVFDGLSPRYNGENNFGSAWMSMLQLPKNLPTLSIGDKFEAIRGTTFNLQCEVLPKNDGDVF